MSELHTELHTAAFCGDSEAAQELIDNGADVNANGVGGETPLFKAVRQRHTEIAQLLIDNGANVDGKNNWGTTPLQQAALNGDTEIVNLLISNGAEINLQDNFGGIALNSSISKDCTKDRIKIIKILIDNGSDVNKQEATKLHTPLHDAVLWGHKEVVDILMSNGADINIEDMFGRTPLCLAKFKGHTKVADLLKAAMKKQKENRKD